MSAVSSAQPVVIREDRDETDRCLKGSGVSSGGEIDAIMVDSDPER
jgi:hypothetical protein